MELSAIMETSCKSALSNMVATERLWLLSTGNVACVTEVLDSEFYFILINLNEYSHIWLEASNLDSTDRDDGFSKWEGLERERKGDVFQSTPFYTVKILHTQMCHSYLKRKLTDHLLFSSSQGQ